VALPFGGGVAWVTHGPPSQGGPCVTRVDAGKWPPWVSCAATRGSAYPSHAAKYVQASSPWILESFEHDATDDPNA
jgi:hypothetical protein